MLCFQLFRIVINKLINFSLGKFFSAYLRLSSCELGCLWISTVVLEYIWCIWILLCNYVCCLRMVYFPKVNCADLITQIQHLNALLVPYKVYLKRGNVRLLILIQFFHVSLVGRISLHFPEFCNLEDITHSSCEELPHLSKSMWTMKFGNSVVFFWISFFIPSSIFACSLSSLPWN